MDFQARRPRAGSRVSVARTLLKGVAYQASSGGFMNTMRLVVGTALACVIFAFSARPAHAQG